MKPIKISELVDALEFDSDERECWVDLKNGTVVHLPHSLVSGAEEGDEKRMESMSDWEPEDVEVAKALVADSGARFAPAPSKFDFHEYRQMERFIGMLPDDAAAQELWRAIKGKGAFRWFKDTAHRLGLLDQWYQFRNEAMKQFAKDWAEVHEVAVEDDAPGSAS